MVVVVGVDEMISIYLEEKVLVKVAAAREENLPGQHKSDDLGASCISYLGIVVHYWQFFTRVLSGT